MGIATSNLTPEPIAAIEQSFEQNNIRYPLRIRKLKTLDRIINLIELKRCHYMHNLMNGENTNTRLTQANTREVQQTIRTGKFTHTRKPH